MYFINTYSASNRKVIVSPTNFTSFYVKSGAQKHRSLSKINMISYPPLKLKFWWNSSIRILFYSCCLELVHYPAVFTLNWIRRLNIMCVCEVHIVLVCVLCYLSFIVLRVLSVLLPPNEHDFVSASNNRNGHQELCFWWHRHHRHTSVVLEYLNKILNSQPLETRIGNRAVRWSQLNDRAQLLVMYPLVADQFFFIYQPLGI